MPGFGQDRAVCQPCPAGERGGPVGQKATLFHPSGEMNGVLKATTSASRLVFSPHH